MTTTTHTHTPAAAPPRDGLLRTALRVDAVVSGSVGAAFLVAGGPLSDAFGVPRGFLLAVGAFCLAYGTFAWVVARPARISRSVARCIAVGNLGWAAASVALALAGTHDPTTAGTAFIVAQALLVAGFAEAQFLGLRRAAGASVGA